MRFVSWNCCEGFTRDLAHLRHLQCDVAVLAGVPAAEPETTLVDPSIDWHWIGTFDDYVARTDQSGRSDHTPLILELA